MKNKYQVTWTDWVTGRTEWKIVAGKREAFALAKEKTTTAQTAVVSDDAS